MKKFKNLFISFEGPEASGKSSQIKLLSKFLKLKKIPHFVTREPGGTKIAEILRKLILDQRSNISSIEEILMLMAARYNHINKVILPNLKKGKIVISDRFADSTFVYQGYVQKYGIDFTKKLHKQLLNNFLPKKTFLFNLHPDEIINRLKKRSKKNKYDILDIKFHKSVNRGYKIVSNSRRFVNIDASQSKVKIQNQILINLNLI
tara:strand:- start:9524 stop:10138 length:615 start_codon:yes stop_codon:yes gene_type:complete